jgi:two-component system chemotaxis sensor kinase CheA
LDDLLTDFLTEVNEGLPELDNAVVELERQPGDRQTLSLIFRHVHTIKGTCGFLGLPRLERVAHAAEDVLGKLRDGELQASSIIIDHVLAALDRIKTIVDELGRSGREPEGDDVALIAALQVLAAGRIPETFRASEPANAVPAPPPPATASDEAPEPAGPVIATNEQFAAQTIRVGVDTLEGLMTLVGELVLTRNQLLQLSRTQTDSPLLVALQRLSRLTSELQDNVMKTRMQPIGHAWNKLPRLVRDLTHDLGKQIELDLQGAETELDRQVLEQIRDPLTHIVRNAADHGLENGADRIAAGKNPVGRITLKAFHEGGHVIIEVSDDGRGLDLARIKAKAIAQNLASEQDVAGMTDAQIQRFIFMPGFSTAATVTSVSGRGVGMDVVKTNIERISGAVELRSVQNRGTTLTIRIPLTLAIVPGLIVSAGGQRFVVPQLGVVELVRASERTGTGTIEIGRIGGNEVLRLREQLLPLVDLAALLQLPVRRRPDAEHIVAVMQAGGATFGIIVDEVFDTEEIVVKPVAPVLRHLTIFGGNTILGDGSVTMILDPSGIARAIGFSGSSHVSETLVPVAGEQQRRPVLLFEVDQDIKAVALEAVARMELFPVSDIEHSTGMTMIQYRGQLMPLVRISPSLIEAAEQPVLVFEDGARRVGLMVSRIVDIVESDMAIELDGSESGVIGTAIIAGRATEVIDHKWWLSQIHEKARRPVGRRTKTAKSSRRDDRSDSTPAVRDAA